jgi:hypothetical protein
LPGSDFFQNSARGFLQFSETREVFLKIVVQKLRVFWAKLRSQNHVTQLDRVWQQRVFLQLLKRDACVIVVHGFPRGGSTPEKYCTKSQLI